jgi:hypothetical protein
MRDKVKELEDFVNSQQTQKVQGEIQDVRSRYPDFAQYQTQMVQLHKQNPGLSVEELYHVAKRRSGGPDTKVDTRTERPSSHSGRPPKRKAPIGNSKADFQRLLDGALENLDLNFESE